VLYFGGGVVSGTIFLAPRAAAVRGCGGADLARGAIVTAGAHLGGAHIYWGGGPPTAFDDPQGFETIVCLETVEHVDDPAALVDHLIGLLRPGGVFVASVPTTPSVDVNPHHRHDFSEGSFRKLVGRHRLHEVDHLRQVQPVSVGSVLRRSEARMQDLRPNLLAWYAANPSSLFRRVAATLRYGFTNRYLTVAWRADDAA
jgi:SAM-dependent methyltransferase